MILKKAKIVFSGNYAPTQIGGKDQFWEHLTHLNTVFDIPWCLMGDLNELGSPEEKKGGELLPRSKFYRLNHFLTEIDVDSIPIKATSSPGKRKYTLN